MLSIMLLRFALLLALLCYVCALPPLFDRAAPLFGGIEQATVQDKPARPEGPGRDHGDHHNGIDFANHPWIPAHQIPGSSRSPCPLLNTLSNHGFSPRSGKNISMTDFNTAMICVLNLAPDFANLLTATNFALLKLIPDEDGFTEETIDLETLNNYTTGAEHDASLSKEDRHLSIRQGRFAEGGTPLGPIVPSSRLIDELMSDLPGPYLTTKSLGLARVRRTRASLASGAPPLNEQARTASFKDAGILLQVFGRGGGGERRALKRHVGEWLRNERFPQGWRRSDTVLLTEDMVALAERVEYWAARGNGTMRGL